MSVAGGAVAALVSYSGRLFHQNAKVSAGQRGTHRKMRRKYEKILLRFYYDVDLFDPPGYEQTEPTCMVDVWYLWPCTP